MSYWPEIASLLPSLFWNPDTEAFHVILATAATHYLKLEDRFYPPTWLLLIGPSGNRKTSQLKLLEKIPNFHFIDQPNSKGFLSGFDPHKTGEHSLLHQIGPSGFLGIADMSSILSAPERNAVLGDLRRIYDGELKPTRGLNIKPWKGRLTVIGCATTEIDAPEYRDQMSALGDRFVNIWTNRITGHDFAKHVVNGMKPAHVDDIKTLVAQCIKHLQCPQVETVPKLCNLAELVALTRTYIKFDRSYHKIDRIGDTETPSRLIQAFHALAFAGAAIDNSSIVRPEDIALATRVAWDTIPRRIYHALRILQSSPMDLTKFQTQMHLLRDSFESFCSRLAAMQLAEVSFLNGTEIIQLSQTVKDLLN